MKRIIILLFVLNVLLNCSDKQKEEGIDKKDLLIAKIEDEEIYLSELLNYFNISPDTIKKNRELKKNYIEQFINDKIIYLEVEKNNIEISDELIKELLRKENEDITNLPEAEYNALFLSKRKQVAIEKLITSKFKIEIKDEELQKYYKDNYQEFYQSEMLQIKQIFLDNEEIAKKVHKMARDGTDFDKLIEEFSISDDKGFDQHIKLVMKGDMPEEFDKVIFKLKENQISDIVKSPYGYHIFKLVKKIPPVYIPFEKAKSKIYKTLYEEKINSIYEKWVAERLKEYSVEINESFLED